MSILSLFRIRGYCFIKLVLFLFFMVIFLESLHLNYLLIVDEQEITDDRQQTAIHGPGELGSGVLLNFTQLPDEDKLLYEGGIQKHKFNLYISDLIPVHRTLNPEILNPKCVEIRYEDLDPCTIIIPLRNAAWSTLMRTVHSILDRSPLILVDQIILVDDQSVDDHLRTQLEIYTSFLSKVTLLSVKNEGRIASLQKTIDGVKPDNVVILDSHCEVFIGWLQPLLKRLKENPKLLVKPYVNVISDKTFEFQISHNFTYTPSFDFSTSVEWTPYKRNYIASLPALAPVRAAGDYAGIFAVSKTFFMQLGGYDVGITDGNAAHLEIIFKYVMCGGDIETMPCSHVGQVYGQDLWRADGDVSYGISGLYRVAEVWMDNYKHYVFERNGNRTYRTGDVSKRQTIREKNKCRPFKYFLDHMREITDFYIPDKLRAHGAIIKPDGNFCLTKDKDQVKLTECSWKGEKQFWEWSNVEELRQGSYCLQRRGKTAQTYLTRCNFNVQWSVQWEYTKSDTLRLQKDNLCLTAKEDNTVYFDKCSGKSDQIWTLKRV